MGHRKLNSIFLIFSVFNFHWNGSIFSDALTRSSPAPRKVVIIGGGWGGLSAAHTLSKQDNVDVTVVDAAMRPGGLVGDGYFTPGGRRAEAGIHGFWDSYKNIFSLLKELNLDNENYPLTDYAEQGQYSPSGLEAIWPVYREQMKLPTGLGQALYTNFLNLSPLDKLTAWPLVVAFSEFDDSDEAWKKYDRMTFRDLCVKLGVSKKMYDESIEPMILTGLFAPGDQCSAAAALGMAYFFVLANQQAFDVRWCKGNVGELIFSPWCEQMASRGVKFLTGTLATDFDMETETETTEAGAGVGRIRSVTCKKVDTSSTTSSTRSTRSNSINGDGGGDTFTLDADEVIFAVGMKALRKLSAVPALSSYPTFASFGKLRGTDVLCCRLWFDREVELRYTANACWGFDDRVGMTIFDVKALQSGGSSGSSDGGGDVRSHSGGVVEVDFYHSGSLLYRSDESIIALAKERVRSVFESSASSSNANGSGSGSGSGSVCTLEAEVVDAAVVRLPEGVNWYFPGSYQYLPHVSPALNNKEHNHGDKQIQQHQGTPSNAYFAGDVVKTRHGSWSQEKAFVTGVEAANSVLGKRVGGGVIPLDPDEAHVKLGRDVVRQIRKIVPFNLPQLPDFIF